VASDSLDVQHLEVTCDVFVEGDDVPQVSLSIEDTIVLRLIAWFEYPLWSTGCHGSVIMQSDFIACFNTNLAKDANLKVVWLSFGFHYAEAGIGLSCMVHLGKGVAEAAVHVQPWHYFSNKPMRLPGFEEQAVRHGVDIEAGIDAKAVSNLKVLCCVNAFRDSRFCSDRFGLNRTIFGNRHFVQSHPQLVFLSCSCSNALCRFREIDFLS
jgi:hypothetical protein